MQTRMLRKMYKIEELHSILIRQIQVYNIKFEIILAIKHLLLKNVF